MAGLPGFPSGQVLGQQAAAAAGAAVPTRGSIMQQYGQGLQDTSAFTRALISLLRSGPNAGAGYTQAEQAQNAIDSAAANRLAALGSPYSAGSAAALQGMGNSALSGLLAKGAAASAYGAKMPGVAAARGALAQQGLITARNQALTQRNQAYTSAYQQALQQARSDALAYSTALGNFNLNTQKLALQNQQFNAELGYRYAALQQNQGQFRSQQALQYQEFLDQQRRLMSGASGTSVGGYTPSEISTMSERGQKEIQGYITSGTPIQVAIQHLRVSGIPPQIARAIASVEYGNMTKPDPTLPIFHPASTTSNPNPLVGVNNPGYKAAMRAYTTAFSSFRKWLFQNAAAISRQQRRRGAASSSYQPPSFQGHPH